MPRAPKNPALPPFAAGAQSGAQAGDDDGAQADLLALAPGVEVDPLESILEDLGSSESGFIAVHRAAGGGLGRDAFLFSVPAASITGIQLLEKLRDEHGGGDYRVRGRRGSQWIGGAQTVSIAAPVKRADAAPAAAAVPAAAAPAGQDQFMQFLLQQQQQSGQTMQAILTGLIARPEPQRGGGNMDKVIAAAAPIASGLLAGLFGMLQQSKPDAMKQLRELLEIRSLVADNGGGGGASESDVMLTAIKEIGPVLAGLMAQRASEPAPAAAPRRPAAPPALAAPGAAIPAPAPAVPAAGAPAAPLSLPQLRSQLGLLLRGAANDSPTEAYAVLLCDLVPEDQLRMLIDHPGFDGLLAGIDPRAAEFADWFAELRQSVRDMLDAPADDGEDVGEAESLETGNG